MTSSSKRGGSAAMRDATIRDRAHQWLRNEAERELSDLLTNPLWDSEGIDFVEGQPIVRLHYRRGRAWRFRRIEKLSRLLTTHN
jgi:hypothetical protein